MSVLTAGKIVTSKPNYQNKEATSFSGDSPLNLSNEEPKLGTSTNNIMQYKRNQSGTETTC